jgi:hypothetical protein
MGCWPGGSQQQALAGVQKQVAVRLRLTDAQVFAGGEHENLMTRRHAPQPQTSLSSCHILPSGGELKRTRVYAAVVGEWKCTW